MAKITNDIEQLEAEFPEDQPSTEQPRGFAASPDDAGTRLDHFLVARIPDVSRARVQQLIDEGKVLVNDRPSKPSLKLKGTEQIEITGELQPPALRATPEDIPLDVVYEDKDIAVINKPAGMMVHAGAATLGGDDPRNRGTLVNALLFRFNALSEVGGDLRPGIVHRLDKDTSGLIVVAKNDAAHHKLAKQFSSREVSKRYIALVHGWPTSNSGTVNAPIGRDRRNPTRMSTQGDEGRDAVSHYTVLERVESSYGKFALVEVKIETGRTHQIRVHMSSIGHPVVGDTLYGAPQVLSQRSLARERAGNAISARVEAKKAKMKKDSVKKRTLTLGRNFLHAAKLELTHPKTKKPMAFGTELPAELSDFLAHLSASPVTLENLHPTLKK